MVPVRSDPVGDRRPALFANAREAGTGRRQIFHFNRALGQISGPEGPAARLRCPEAYYRESGRYIPNDHVPLLWTQANLLTAFAAMEGGGRRVSVAFVKTRVW